MISAIFFDIDDTLIARRNTRVSDEDVMAIKACHDKGIRIIISTGRGYYAMQQDIKDRIPSDYLITVNGACINNHDGTVMKSYPMSLTNTEGLIKDLLERDITFGFKFDDSLQVYNHYEDFTDRYCSPAVPVSMIDDNTSTKDYHLTHGLPLAIFIFADGKCGDLREKYPEMVFVDAPRDASMCEGFNKEVNKGATIRYLTSRLDIPLSECMAFGDGINDLEMIQMCGIGIAMGNAVEKVKQDADYITDTVLNSGIAKALKHFELI